MNEALAPIDQKRQETGDPLASESQHWYRRDGSPCYEVPRSKGDGTRPATLADARKLDLVPSVSLILKCAAAPGLEIWKLRKMLEAALTLPKIDGETEADYVSRIIEDSQAEGKKAAERGTELHAAIETAIRTQVLQTPWEDHILSLITTLNQHGIRLSDARAEHSFACGAGYGGKVDFQNDTLLLDFKSKERIDPKLKPYDNHLMQCAAYAYGLGLNRAGNVFIGIEDKQVRVFLYEKEDLAEAFAQFSHLLAYWQIKNRFGDGYKK
jgi:hypothetical protein